MENNYGHLVRYNQSNLEKYKTFWLNFEEINKGSFIHENIKAIIYSHLISSLTKQLKKCGQTNQLDNEGIIPNVIKYINDNLDKNLSLDSISEYFLVNKFHLTRI